MHIQEWMTVLRPFEPVVALRASVGDLVIERRADLVLKHKRALPGYEIMELGCEPHDGGAYPHFRGTLIVEDMGANYCRLELSGGYTPPLGIMGATFDAIAGHHIAVAVARELLDEIRIGFEFAFQTGLTMT